MRPAGVLLLLRDPALPRRGVSHEIHSNMNVDYLASMDICVDSAQSSLRAPQCQSRQHSCGDSSIPARTRPRAFVLLRPRHGKPHPSMMANGMLAGLVAITAPCAFVTSISAVITRLVAGVLVVWAALFIERTMKVDDPVGAVAAHGVNAAWGVLALGLFADAFMVTAGTACRERCAASFTATRGSSLRRAPARSRASSSPSRLLRVLQTPRRGGRQPCVGRGGARGTRRAGGGRARLSRLRPHTWARGRRCSRQDRDGSSARAATHYRQELKEG
jgi:hypothetical protein